MDLHLVVLALSGTEAGADELSDAVANGDLLRAAGLLRAWALNLRAKLPRVPPKPDSSSRWGPHPPQICPLWAMSHSRLLAMGFMVCSFHGFGVGHLLQPVRFTPLQKSRTFPVFPEIKQMSFQNQEFRNLEQRLEG